MASIYILKQNQCLLGRFSMKKYTRLNFFIVLRISHFKKVHPLTKPKKKFRKTVKIAATKLQNLDVHFFIKYPP